MDTTWILIASGERARCFERHASDHSLTELTDFVFPRASPNGDAGKGHGRTAHAGTQFEPHTELQDLARASFAQMLATYLNDSIVAKRYSSLVLITSSQMLGQIRPMLNIGASNALTRSVTSDLTHFTGIELRKSVDHAMAMAD